MYLFNYYSFVYRFIESQSQIFSKYIVNNYGNEITIKRML